MKMWKNNDWKKLENKNSQNQYSDYKRCIYPSNIMEMDPETLRWTVQNAVRIIKVSQFFLLLEHFENCRKKI